MRTSLRSGGAYVACSESWMEADGILIVRGLQSRACRVVEGGAAVIGPTFAFPVDPDDGGMMIDGPLTPRGAR